MYKMIDGYNAVLMEVSGDKDKTHVEITIYDNERSSVRSTKIRHSYMDRVIENQSNERFLNVWERLLEDKKSGELSFDSSLMGISFYEYQSVFRSDVMKDIDNAIGAGIATKEALSNLITPDRYMMEVVAFDDDRLAYDTTIQGVTYQTSTPNIKDRLLDAKRQEALIQEMITDGIDSALRGFNDIQEELERRREHLDMDGYLDGKSQIAIERAAQALSKVYHYKSTPLGIDDVMSRKNFIRHAVKVGATRGIETEYTSTGKKKQVYVLSLGGTAFREITKTEYDYMGYLQSL